MSMTKNFYWEEITNGQMEAKLAEDLDIEHQIEMQKEVDEVETKAERQKFFDVFDVTHTYPM